MASLHPKTHITTFARTLVTRKVAGQPLDVFIAGDDAAAKATIPQLVEAGSPTGRNALSRHYAPGPARHPLHERLEIALPMRKHGLRSLASRPSPVSWPRMPLPGCCWPGPPALATQKGR